MPSPILQSIKMVTITADDVVMDTYFLIAVIILPDRVAVSINARPDDTWGMLKARIQTFRGLDYSALHFHTGDQYHPDTDLFGDFILPHVADLSPVLQTFENITSSSGAPGLAKTTLLADNIYYQLR